MYEREPGVRGEQLPLRGGRAVGRDADPPQRVHGSLAVDHLRPGSDQGGVAGVAERPGVAAVAGGPRHRLLVNAHAGTDRRHRRRVGAHDEKERNGTGLGRSALHDDALAQPVGGEGPFAGPHDRRVGAQVGGAAHGVVARETAARLDRADGLDDRVAGSEDDLGRDPYVAAVHALDRRRVDLAVGLRPALLRCRQDDAQVVQERLLHRSPPQGRNSTLPRFARSNAVLTESPCPVTRGDARARPASAVPRSRRAWRRSRPPPSQHAAGGPEGRGRRGCRTGTRP